MMDIPFSYDECVECIYTENLQERISELESIINELLEENEGYRQSNKRLMDYIEKYEEAK